MPSLLGCLIGTVLHPLSALIASPCSFVRWILINGLGHEIRPLGFTPYYLYGYRGSRSPNPLSRMSKWLPMDGMCSEPVRTLVTHEEARIHWWWTLEACPIALQSSLHRLRTQHVKKCNLHDGQLPTCPPIQYNRDNCFSDPWHASHASSCRVRPSSWHHLFSHPVKSYAHDGPVPTCPQTFKCSASGLSDTRQGPFLTYYLSSNPSTPLPQNILTIDKKGGALPKYTPRLQALLTRETKLIGEAWDEDVQG